MFGGATQIAQFISVYMYILRHTSIEQTSHTLTKFSHYCHMVATGKPTKNITIDKTNKTKMVSNRNETRKTVSHHATFHFQNKGTQCTTHNQKRYTLTQTNRNMYTEKGDNKN